MVIVLVALSIPTCNPPFSHFNGLEDNLQKRMCAHYEACSLHSSFLQVSVNEESECELSASGQNIRRKLKSILIFTKHHHYHKNVTTNRSDRKNNVLICVYRCKTTLRQTTLNTKKIRN